MDIIRVLRLIEYVGPRDLVEEQLFKSIHGTRTIDKPDKRSITIRAVTLGEVSEILGRETVRYVCAYEPRIGEYAVFAGPFDTLDEAFRERPTDPNLLACILSGTGKDDLTPVYMWYDGDGGPGWYDGTDLQKV